MNNATDDRPSRDEHPAIAVIELLDALSGAAGSPSEQERVRQLLRLLACEDRIPSPLRQQAHDTLAAREPFVAPSARTRRLLLH